jgi:membrane protein DedA with SNARE-associated domain
VNQVVDTLRALGPYAPFVVFIAATAESAGFVGLFVPGEMLTIVGGAVAGLSGTPVWWVIVAAVLGAFLGDSIGYWIGQKFGARLLQHRFLARARGPFDRAGDYLDSHGSTAFVVARFMPVIRSFVPMAAGAGRVEYRRFVVPNAVGCVAWGLWASPEADPEALLQVVQRGVTPMPPWRALDALGAALPGAPDRSSSGDAGAGPPAAVVIADLDWPRFGPSYAEARHRPLIADLVPAGGPAGAERALAADELARLGPDAGAAELLALVTRHVATALGREPADVPADRDLAEVGLDSLRALELRNRLSGELGRRQ